MSKAILGLTVFGVIGALAFAANRANAAPDGAPPGGAVVTGASGTTYGLVKIDSANPAAGVLVERWEVSDGLGSMLIYTQNEGDDSTRQILALSPGRKLDDVIVQHAISDFGIFTGL